jgi:hypothetical protein
MEGLLAGAIDACRPGVGLFYQALIGCSLDILGGLTIGRKAGEGETGGS